MAEPTEEQRKQWEEKIKKMSPEELLQLQKQQCIFCQIISGKIPSKKVYEDKSCVALLDINPGAKGHLLILPKEHYAIMPQVPEEILGHLTLVVKHLSQVLLKVLRADGTTVFIANGAAAGQRAQHFMIHLIPRRKGDGLLIAEEKFAGKDMGMKVKTAIEHKLSSLLGKRKITDYVKEEAKEAPKIVEKEIFITSAKAKRYHKEKCAFAQNIPETDKVILSKEEAEKSARKPCTCVSGKKIPLVKPVAQSSHSVRDLPEGRKKEKKQKEKVEKKLESKNKKISSGKDSKKKKEGVSLDDIANLFK